MSAMQNQMKLQVLFTCFLGSLAHIALVQMKANELSKLNRSDGLPSSTCSKNSGSNLYWYCPQDQCYGDSQCCLSTGACTSFESSICVNANKCESGACASSGNSSFPAARSSANPASYHQKTHLDGCTCVKAKDTCTSGNCWGTMQCTGSGSCQTTQQCTDGVDVANVGDFCMMPANDPACFKFCGTPPTPAPTTAEPTPDPTPLPTPVPTAVTTTTTTCSTYAGTTSCTLYGDPHLHGFDDSEEGPASLGGARFMLNIDDLLKTNVAFDGHPIYLDVGDHWLIKSEMLSVQARYVPSAEFKQGGAVVGAIAISGPALDSKRLIVGPRNGSLVWDGHVLSFGAFQARLSHGDFTVSNSVLEVQSMHPFSQVVIHLPMGTDLLINRYDTFLNVKITMLKDGLRSLGNVEGQCGNANGIEEDDTLPEIDRRMHGSTVLPEDSLFD